MTQIGEPLLIAFISEFKSENKCSHEEDKTGWECKLEGKTEGHLTTNIPEHGYEKEPTWPPAVGKPTLNNCSKNTWPSQAHHLIPWQHLKNEDKVHKIVVYLAMSENTLWADNDYSVNHGNNGYFMPFVSNLPEWSEASNAKEQKIAEDVMNKSGIQLHQSKHSYTKYECAEMGYKEAVDSYLNRIFKESITHYKVCKQCKDNAKANKLPPRKAVVHFVDKASQLLKADIIANRIFVSRRAAKWACGKKK